MFQTTDLGRMDYESALRAQREHHAAVLAGQSGPVVLLVEHEPVITVGRQPDATRHLLADPDMLQAQGVSLCRTDRGGDITYHGPGQLVVYPIIPLNQMKLNLRRYIRCLEQAIIDALAAFNVKAHRDACAVGVWVGGQPVGQPDPATACPTGAQAPARQADDQTDLRYTGGAKIAAIGVRVQRWVTLHGLALNVKPDMNHFKLIVPCGLAGRPVTSLAEQLGDRCPSMAQVKSRLVEQLEVALATAPRVSTDAR